MTESRTVTLQTDVPALPPDLSRPGTTAMIATTPGNAIDAAAVAALQRRISALTSRGALTDAPYTYHR